MPKITLYYKSHCGASQGVLALLKSYRLDFDVVDLSASLEVMTQMVFDSGQTMAPSVRIDDTWLTDLNAQDLERYLIIHSIVKSNGVSQNTNAPKLNAILAQRAQRRDTIRFF